MKPFILNLDYKFDFNGNYQYKNKLIIDNDEEIVIDIHGHKSIFNKLHLGRYIHFEFNPFMIEFDNIYFKEVKSKVLRFRAGCIPIFKKPIEIGYGFRIIPGFSDFAINEKGDVLSYKTGKILSRNINYYGYHVVNIFDPDKGFWRGVMVHLLLARAFIHNDNPSNNFYINHKDGNKLNLSLDNLEWVSPKENVRHAVRNGLANLTGLDKGRNPISVTVHDLLTGESIDYDSITEAINDGKMSKTWNQETKKINGVSYPRVHFKRYVVTNKGDMFPGSEIWMNGEPGYRTPLIGPYQCLNVKNGEIKEFDMIKDAVRELKVPYHHVSAILNSDKPYESKGFYFRVKSEEEFPDNIEPLIKLKRRRFKVTNKDTGEVQIFPTLASLMKLLKCAEDTILKIVNKEKYHPDYEIIEIENF